MQDNNLTPDELKELQELEERAELAELERKEAGKSVSYGPIESGEQELTKTQSALLGAAEGLTFGAAPSLVAATETGAQVIKDAYNNFITDEMKDNDNPSATISERYARNKKYADQMFEQAMLDNPTSYTTGDIAGTLATSLVGGGTTALKSGAGFAKNATVLARQGAVSFVHGIGDSSEESIDSVVKEGAGAAAIGTGIELASPLVGKAARFTAKKLGDITPGALITFLGDKFSTVEDNLQKVGKDTVDWADRILSLKGVDGKDLITRTASRKDLGKRFDDARQMFGSKMGETLTQADNLLEAAGKPLDAQALRNQLEAEFVLPLINSVKVTEQEAAKEVLKYLDTSFTKAGVTKLTRDAKTGLTIPNTERIARESISLNELHSIQNDIFTMTKPNIKNTNINKVANNELRSVGSKISSKIDEVLASNPILRDGIDFTSYKQARQSYGDLKEGIKAIENSMKENGSGLVQNTFNRSVVKYTSAGAILGASLMSGSHTAVGMAAVGLGAIAGSKRINGMVAKSAKVLKETLESDPEKFAPIASKLLNSMSLSATDAMETFPMIAAEASLLKEPLARNAQEVLRRSDNILVMVDQIDEAIGDNLRQAIDKRDEDAIGSIMSQVSSSLPKGYVQEGMGWGGKAYTQAEIAGVQNYLQGIKNTRKRMLMTTEFNKTNMIPQEMYAPEQQEPMNQFIYRKAKDKIRNPEY